jgi:hypothetical protein
MRVMVIVKSSMESEAGKMPSPQLLADMGKFNQELMKGGIFLDAGGLQPSSKGKGIRFSGSRRTVSRRPFTETKERPRNLSAVSEFGRFAPWNKLSSGSNAAPMPMTGTPPSKIRKLFEVEDLAQSQ